MSYKVEEPDGTTTVYDNKGNLQFKQDPNWPLVPQGHNNALVPQGYNNALVPSNQSNALIIADALQKSSNGSFGWSEALA